MRHKDRGWDEKILVDKGGKTLEARIPDPLGGKIPLHTAVIFKDISETSEGSLTVSHNFYDPYSNRLTRTHEKIGSVEEGLKILEALKHPEII